MRGRMRNFLALTLLVGTGAAISAAPAAAQASYSQYAETPSAALARYVRLLASSPNDFSSLIGAGRAALAVGDAQAAAGFFARADEANPRSPLPQAGMGAVSVANGEPQAALPYFTRAQQLGAPVATFGADRGLAYDLMGRQAEAQADYRAALGGLDSAEARRRLSLSLAISGKQAEALQVLAPLGGDAGARRTRAFVLALGGDSNAAMAAFDAAMPGSWSSIAPFLKRLPGLSAGQKAAAVNLGIFPDSSTAYAYAAAPSAPPASYTSADTVPLASVDQLLRAPAPPQAQPAAQPSWQQAPTQLASASIPPRLTQTRSKAATAAPRKLWLQLASGQNADALSGQFRRIKSRNSDLFDGISGYVARGPDRSRLVIGPFRGTSDAQIFQQDLESVGIDAFSWTSSETDTIVPLGT
jgi:Flp pilus assembly protein TadD